MKIFHEARGLKEPEAEEKSVKLEEVKTPEIPENIVEE